MKPVPPRRPTKMDPIEQEIEAGLQSGYFIKYGAGWSFVEGLDRVEGKIAKLVRSAPARAGALYDHVFRMTRGVGRVTECGE